MCTCLVRCRRQESPPLPFSLPSTPIMHSHAVCAHGAALSQGRGKHSAPRATNSSWAEDRSRKWLDVMRPAGPKSWLDVTLSEKGDGKWEGGGSTHNPRTGIWHSTHDLKESKRRGHEHGLPHIFKDRDNRRRRVDAVASFKETFNSAEGNRRRGGVENTFCLRPMINDAHP